MPKTNYQNIDEYHKSFPLEVVKRMQVVRELVHTIAPKAEESISYQIPVFKLDGKALVYYAGFKNHISIVYPFSKEMLVAYKSEFKKYKLSKSAMQIPHTMELPVSFISKIIRWRKKEDTAKKSESYEKQSKILDRVYKMTFASVYPLYIQKAEKKGRTKTEVDKIIVWLTGYTKSRLSKQIDNGVSFETFFNNAPNWNPNVSKITGIICGYRVEDIKDPLMQKIRYLDKLIDELAKGKSIDKILRS